MIKRFFIFITALFLIAGNAGAVLKEKDLARTLGVLRAELEKDWKKQQQFMLKYEQQGIQQHEKMVDYLNQCEQISLILFSQSTENTFDMAYACNQATQLYTEINQGGIENLPYDRIIQHMKLEIERMEALIKSLKSMHLTGQQLKDREVCLKLAIKMHSYMRKFLISFESERKYYESVQDKVNDMHTFAQSRYKVLQDNIFKTGSKDYFSLLMSLPSELSNARYRISDKYTSFDDKDATFSQWRGLSLLYLLGFVFLWLPVSLLVSWILLRLLTPKRWRIDDYKYRRSMINNIVGIILFGIVVWIVREIYDKDSFYMGSELLLGQCWLMLIIFLSLFVRLKGKQMILGTQVYLPIILMAFVIILFRIVLIPNLIVNILCPPLLLGFSIWQLVETLRNRKALPVLDKIFTNITTAVMFICCIMSWTGYAFFAVQVLIWWTLQLASIITISCLYDVLKYVEINWVARYINPQLVKRYKAGENVDKEYKSLQKEMKSGKHITQTWIYDFVKQALLPYICVGSIAYSIWWAAQVFDLQGLCLDTFTYHFVDIEGVIQLSIYNICVVAAMFFMFSWVNYTMRSMYVHYRMKFVEDEDNFNYTLAKNIIAILTWGLYIIISLIILKVPSSGISIITAGLATGMGFAMKDLLENFFYGISLMTGRVRVGDYIECDGIVGRVTCITYQSTQLDTLDGCVIAILNSALFTKNFKNITQTDDYQFVKLPVGVAYGTTLDQVRAAVVPAMERDCAKNLDAAGNPRSDRKPLLDPNKKVTIRFADFGANSVDVWVCVWSRVEEYPWLLPHWKEVIYNALNDAGIEMPYPQLEVHMK